MKSRGRSPGSTSDTGAIGTVPRHKTTPVITGRGSVSGRSLAGDREHSQESSNRLTVPASKAASDTGSLEASQSTNSPSHHSKMKTPSVSSSGHNVEIVPRTPGSNPGEGLGNSVFYDNPDLVGVQHTPDPALTQRAIDQVQDKVDRTKELIKEEQSCSDANVEEYLKLSSNADKHQLARIKAVFEKKNAKCANNIAHYQKKLLEYQEKILQIQEHGIRPKQTQRLGLGLKSVGGNIRDAINKPKEIAAHLFKPQFRNRIGFGSADNLSTISKESDSEAASNRHRNPLGSASLPRDNSGLSGQASSGTARDRHSSLGSKRKSVSDDGKRSENSESYGTRSSESYPNPHLNNQPGGVSPQRAAEWNAVMQELQLHREEVDNLREEMEEMRLHYKQEYDSWAFQLREERDRCERLEV